MKPKAKWASQSGKDDENGPQGRQGEVRTTRPKSQFVPAMKRIF